MKEIKNSLISKREKEILHLIAYENSTKDIARELFISEHTVVTHRKNLLYKMEVKNTAGLVRKAFEYGYLQLSQRIAIVLIAMVSIVTTNVSGQCDTTEFLALKAFYNSTNGDMWFNNTGWDLVKNNSLPPLVCDLSNMSGISYYSGSVNLINLPNENLTGVLPPEIGDLKNLGGLWLENNLIAGSIPNEIGNLTNLQYLRLHNNSISGSIPQEIGNLINLEYLRLHSNSISGTIPSEIGQLSNLEELRLHSNSLSGSIPAEIGDMNSLNNLSLYNNINLIGCFPPNLKNICSQLTTVSIDIGTSFDADWDDFCASDDGICGCNEDDFTALKALYDNTFGNIWTDTTGWSAVKNNTSCPSGFSLGSLYGVGVNGAERVDSVRLRNNNLGGSLPDALGLLSELRTFNVSKNTINGIIPDTLGTLPELEQLLIHDNAFFDQSLPVAGFPSLKVYSATDNDIRGGIPPEIANITTLEEIWLSNNPVLLGHLPAELGDLPNLNTLRVGNCGLDSCFAINLQNLCGQLTNTQIDDMNGFDDTWANFCNNQAGMCTDCDDTSIEWTGLVDDSWDVAANWSSGCVPAPGDTVIINNGGTVLIESGVEARCMTLTLDNGSNFSVQAGGKLRLANSPDYGMNIRDGVFNNYGKTVVKNTTNEAIIIEGQFLNIDTLLIENARTGIKALSGVFSHFGLLQILNMEEDGLDLEISHTNHGQIIMDSIGDYGIQTSNTFTNSGYLKLEQAERTAISCDGKLINNDSIFIFLGDEGIIVEDSIINEGMISIDSIDGHAMTTQASILNKGKMQLYKIDADVIYVDGSFFNLDTIIIDDGWSGINSYGHISNSGYISAKNLQNDGISAESTFMNTGTIMISDSYNTGIVTKDTAVNNGLISMENIDKGLETKGLFHNNDTIKICKSYSGQSVIDIRSGSRFNNHGTIDIDSVATGINNRDTLINYLGGLISIIQVSDINGNYGTENTAISNSGYIENNGAITAQKSRIGLGNYGTFINNLILNIMESGDVNNGFVAFDNSGHFVNNKCGGQFYLSTGFSTSDLFLNEGVFRQEYDGANTINGDTLKNNGLYLNQMDASFNITNGGEYINDGMMIGRFSQNYTNLDTVKPFYTGTNNAGITVIDINTWNGTFLGNSAGTIDLINNEYRPNEEAASFKDFALTYQLPGCSQLGSFIAFDNPFGTSNSDCNIWEGTVSTDWFTAGNWSLDHVPTNSECVFIPATSTVLIPTNTTAVCKLLEVATNVDFTIDGTITVVVEEP